jgi:hypothetical protein
MGRMKKEELINGFQNVLDKYFYEMNDERTRRNIIQEFEYMILSFQNERKFLYSLMRQFVDTTTDEEIYRGLVVIDVELIDGRVVTIGEYCDLLTDKEQYSQLLWWGIKNRKFKN